MQPSVSKATYEVRDPAHRLVASGKVKGGREAALSLPPGTYTYRSLANRLTQPFEELTFSVLACVQVVPRCRAVEVENPNAATLGVLLISIDDEETEVAGDGDLTTVPAHQTVTIPWTGSSAWVLALAQEAWAGSTSFLSLASSFSADGDPSRWRSRRTADTPAANRRGAAEVARLRAVRVVRSPGPPRR